MPAAPEALELSGAPTIRGEVAGEGPPVVLSHGITATRRYVVHGSRALERAGHRVVAYDARGHGESDPAPQGEGYVYPELVGDLGRVVDATAGDGQVVLAGHSMGAHTAVAYALAKPERIAALVIVGPAYDGSEADAGSVAYWAGLADALEKGGPDAFVAYIEREQGIDPRWRDSVLRFTRERVAAHRHPEAVAEAIRQVSRSRPFGGLDELEGLEVPALVVASGDEADPGHPYAVAEEYARRLPLGKLVSEAEGQSPLAWQGGRLSREIAAFVDLTAAGPPETQE